MTPNEFQQAHQQEFYQPNGTLKNKLNITGPNQLQIHEYRMVAHHSRRVIANHMQINTVNDLIKLHQYLFGTLYDWAGRLRNSHEDGQTPFELRKNGHDFLPAMLIPQMSQIIDQDLRQCQSLGKLPPEMYGKLLNEINDWHAFPEGNGRTTKTALQCLAHQHGQELNYDRHQGQLIKLLNYADPGANQAIGQLLHITDYSPKQPTYIPHR